eukprot:TRINITY_DN5996_c0_g2_i1.p1 TRINITY_DN5996_c0_g2~~TRINITY_DN5996_c0_g2_i1.p1  ORF type:complete len:1186 (-),score=164.77 TRINITY_DN5996_c0_g2_i1:961-4518(-)
MRRALLLTPDDWSFMDATSGDSLVVGNDYELFEMVKVVQVKSSDKDNKSPATISLSASGGYSGHEFVAFYLSNDYFLFRLVGSSGVPVVRQLPWFKEPQRKIVAMDFNPSARWLLCITADLTIVIIPIYFILVNVVVDTKKESREEGKAFQDANDNVSWMGRMFSRPTTPTKPGELGSLTDLTVIRAVAKATSSGVTGCCWWHSWTGADYAIISSNSGNLRIVDLQSHAVTRVSFQFTIEKMELIVDPEESFKYLLLETKSNGYHKLFLEVQVQKSYDTIVKSPTSPNFQPMPMNRFLRKTDTMLSKQYNRDSPFVGVLNMNSKRMELFDANLGKFPFYSYQIGCDRAVRFVHMTDECLFVGSNLDEQRFQIQVFSRLLCGNSTNKEADSSPILQTFLLPSGQIIHGNFRAFPNVHRPQSLNGFYCWSQDTLYEIKPKQSPEKMFFKLLASSRDDEAEIIGTAFKLDILHLYETAADERFAKQDYGRALALYYLSNIEVNKLVSLFLGINRMDIVITKLRGLLRRPQSMSASDQKRISQILLRCYIQRLLSTHVQGEIDQDLQEFLQTNTEYDTQEALSLCLRHGLIYYFLVIAHTKDIVERALTMARQEGTVLSLTQTEREYVRKNFLSDEIKACAYGTLVNSLDTKEQLKFYLDDPYTVGRHLNDIHQLLPFLDEETLIKLAGYFDPLSETMSKLFTFMVTGPRIQQKTATNDSAEVGREAYVELHITILLALQHLRQKQQRLCEGSSFTDFGFILKNQPKKSPDAKKVDSISVGPNHVLVLTWEGEVWSWGRNQHGQLGLGHREDQMSPCRVKKLHSTMIWFVCAGAEHSVAADEEGNIWTWGSSKRGQLGHGDTKSSLYPKKIMNFKIPDIIRILCGESMTVVHAKDGVYIWGDSYLGQGEATYTPFKISFDRSLMEVAQVACGYSHVAILSAQGEVSTFGNGAHGQLGHGDTKDRYNPELVSELLNKHISVISCGAYTTIAISELFNVYFWGTSNINTHPTPSTLDLTPRIIDSLRGKKIVNVVCGFSHAIAITDKGEVYQWGTFIEDTPRTLEGSGKKPKNSDTNSDEYSTDDTDDDGYIVVGQKKSPGSDQKSRSAPIIPTPVLAFTGKTIAQVECGDGFTVVLLENGTIYSWGSGKYGQLGHGSVGDLPTPTLVDLSKECENVKKKETEKKERKEIW